MTRKEKMQSGLHNNTTNGTKDRRNSDTMERQVQPRRKLVQVHSLGKDVNLDRDGIKPSSRDSLHLAGWLQSPTWIMRMEVSLAIVSLADGNLRELSGEEAWKDIKNLTLGQKEWDNSPNIIFEQELANLKVQAKRLFGNEKVQVEIHRGITWDKVENPNPQSIPQVLPSFEEYTLSVTYPKEAEETIGIPMEVEPLDETQLKDLGLNTCNHDIPLSNREVPSFDEPEPQPNCPSLDVSLGEERGPEPPIKPHSPDSFRMKEVDSLTIHTPPSPHVASFHLKDTYCYYHPTLMIPKKHYGF
ncbi:hypothetical protein Tco_0904679 [Tanacetum coccineum]